MAAKQALKDQHAANKATKKERADWCASLHNRCMSIFPLLRMPRKWVSCYKRAA